MTTPNAELAYAVLDAIDATPKLWNQKVWIAKADCGTMACFAGWACLLSSDRPDIDERDENEAEYVWVEGGATVYIPRRAAALLGIYYDEDHEFGHDLFDSNRSRAALDGIVAEIFGPRPEPTA